MLRIKPEHDRFRVPHPLARLHGMSPAEARGDDQNGALVLTFAKHIRGALRTGPLRTTLRLIVSVGEGWEHVSVSLVHRLPTWEEMAWVRDQLWDPEDSVMQLHPPADEYVNAHPFTLHLWRPTDQPVPRPPRWMVGGFHPIAELRDGTEVLLLDSPGQGGAT